MEQQATAPLPLYFRLFGIEAYIERIHNQPKWFVHTRNGMGGHRFILFRCWELLIN